MNNDLDLGHQREVARRLMKGFLGDEKALKEINDSKGASGASDYIECSLCI